LFSVDLYETHSFEAMPKSLIERSLVTTRKFLKLMAGITPSYPLHFEKLMVLSVKSGQIFGSCILLVEVAASTSELARGQDWHVHSLVAGAEPTKKKKRSYRLNL
jgi:hypothetical protein